MGCTGSKQSRRRERSPPPYSRSQSMPIPAAAPADKSYHHHHNHVVSLTSSTLGSLRLDYSVDGGSPEEMMKSTNDRAAAAKTWSDMIERRIPRTPCKTPSEDGQPETINAWELMAGLEDASPLRPVTPPPRSVSLDTVREEPPLPPPATVWMPAAAHPDNSNSIISDFDPEVLSTFRKALDELSPRHSFILDSTDPPPTPEHKKPPADHRFGDGGGHNPNPSGIVKARVTAFQEKINARRSSGSPSPSPKAAPSIKYPPGGERRVVFYFTSLRGVRKTYEDCWAVRVILQGYGVRVDERDVSMHGGFKDELHELLGGVYRLPLVFADGTFLGSAEEVRQMHETGDLGRALEGCEIAMVADKGGGVRGQCEGCGDVRFVPCETCSGSCKVFVEEEEEDDGEEIGGGSFRRCPDCNENGLIRCPLCC